ncbi:hypothetical protein DCS_01245 [Drechmeria coniospora]|uniref:Heat-labile enterotoxin IIA, A chain n=1 Tax=Drechmeria coniospora TaxID=98403 RepID=A0A151GSS0_DRECN|nr:hypothetical protein DCS_01245 [Drechmeria coniospora]KYK60111.1 hypothetical protein DCS_01245 [Drechmeria coniospora]
MNGFWFSRVLWAAFLLLFASECAGHLVPSDAVPTISKRTPGLGGSKPQREDSDVQSVWRGETGRTPAEVEQDGGIYSRGFQKSLANIKFSDDEIEAGSSLFLHTKGGTRHYTQFVSTTTDLFTALFFAAGHDPNKPGYIYKIRADPKLVDVNKSLGRHSPFADQAEFAAVGFIPFDQIEGWRVFSVKDLSKKLEKDIRAGRLDDFYKGFHQNDKFNPEYRSLRSSGPQPQLAGFPKDEVAWKETPWNAFAGQAASNNLADFWQKICGSKLIQMSFNKNTKQKVDACEMMRFGKGTVGPAPKKDPTKPKAPKGTSRGKSSTKQASKTSGKPSRKTAGKPSRKTAGKTSRKSIGKTSRKGFGGEKA